jgi:hypothetical protein
MAAASSPTSVLGGWLDGALVDANAPAWLLAVGPWPMLQEPGRYYSDEPQAAQAWAAHWDSRVRGSSDEDRMAPVDSPVSGREEWWVAPDGSTPIAPLRACLEGLAPSGMRLVAWHLLSAHATVRKQHRQWRCDVAVCYHAPGKARAWCARLLVGVRWGWAADAGCQLLRADPGVGTAPEALVWAGGVHRGQGRVAPPHDPAASAWKSVPQYYRTSRGIWWGTVP